jgi:antirestriction protein ArdC
VKENKMRDEMKTAFLAALKEEKIPWVCDWTKFKRPQNAVSQRQYHGINSIWLSYIQMERRYQDPRWCTFKQAQDKGWQIKKGEKGSRVEFWSLYDTKGKKKLQQTEIDLLRTTLGEDFFDRVKPIASIYVVFNGEQIKGIPDFSCEKNKWDAAQLLAKRDIIIKNMELTFLESGDRAFYSPDKDQITMPKAEYFKTEYGYISTFLHEAGHATGHKSRLNRNIQNSFGTPDYAREELRAEIASAFTAQELKIRMADAIELNNRKAYIQSWIEILEKNPNELFASIKDAEKISDYLIEKGEWKQKTESQTAPNIKHKKR